MPPINQLPRSTPEAQGIASSAILAFVNAADQHIHELHSVMLLRHGAVVAEGWWSPYRPELPHMLFSLSKSFTSSAIGLAVSEGLLSLDDKVIGFFPDEAPAQPSEFLAALRVRDLLSMSTGQAEDALPRLSRTASGNWVEGFFTEPVVYPPGTHFVYNSGASYMLSAILQKRTGIRLLDYLEPRLMQPLGITGAAWEVSPQGIDTGGWGLSIRTEDIARFMQMYAQNGVWNGQQILPAEWVREATRKHIGNENNDSIDWQQGYGYQFWRCRHGAYRGDGAFGQFGIVLPEQDAVLAITSGTEDMQSILNLVWEHLLPAFGASPLPEDPAAHAILTEKLASLALKPLQGQTSPRAAEYSRRYVLAGNDLGIQSVSFDFTSAPPVLTATTFLGELAVPCGAGEWLEGTVTVPNNTFRYAVSGAWAGEDTFTIVLRFIETPFHFTIQSRFSGTQVEADAKINAFFYPVAYHFTGHSA